MALYTISDTHLSLGVRDKPMDIFGDRWKFHTEKLVEGWEALVTGDDTVVVGGDVSWAMTLEEALPDLQLLNSLPGIKLLGRGNHDYWWETSSKMNAFFEANALTTLRILYNNSYLADGFRICGSRGWFQDKKSAPGDADYAKISAREAARISLSVASRSENLRAYGDGGADCAEDANNTDDPDNTLLFLHFPPVYGGMICRPILDSLHENGIRRCFYGHIHNVYDIPPSFEYEGIEFTITSADYLHFYPLLIK